MSLGRLLMHVGWTLLCPGAGQGAAGKRTRMIAWAAASLLAAVAFAWVVWALYVAVAIHIASAIDAARYRETSDKNLPLYASLAGVAAFVFFQFATDRYFVPSDSMMPTIAPGDTIYASKLASWQRGDVVVFTHPCEGTTHVKRIAAVAGDTIEVRCGKLFVNGATSEQNGDPAKDYPSLDNIVSSCRGSLPTPSFVVHRQTDTCAPQAHLVVPADTVFVLGDNRAVANDSRAWGLLSTSRIHGRAIGVAWPLSRARSL